jgi:S1-C subfamily serine protease
MNSAVRDWSDGLAELVEAGGRSVVRVESERAHPGSGIVWSEGVIVTTAHPLAEQEEAEVGLPQGGEARGEVAGVDAALDLAVLRVEAAGLVPARFASLDALKVGHLVLALARPGRSVRARLGIVSAFGESWRTHAGGRIDRYLETDHDLPRGYSGGLLVSADGAALGLVTAGLLRGHTLTIPAATLQRVVDAILAKGNVQRGYLGVNTYPVPLPAAAAQATGQEQGLIVLSVQPDSPAEQAGLMQGDVLLSLLGSRLAHLHDLIEILGEDAAGKEAEIGLWRSGQRLTLRIKIGQRDAA